MRDQVEFPVVLVERPLSDTGGALTLPLAQYSAAYVGMTIILVDDERRQREGEVIDVGNDQVRLVYPTRRRLLFWRR
jgi:hypothetical protein